ncbi:MAG: DUF885 family protein, partial [Planctomycetaceae bacterium]|nr:DUF885 family protein [Planctomycetaceae bacterium]
MKPWLSVCLVLVSSSVLFAKEPQTMDRQFEELAKRYVKEFPALSPVSATQLGDHRFDHELDDVSEEGRKQELTFCKTYLKELEDLDREKLSRANQVDYSLLQHRLR